MSDLQGFVTFPGVDIPIRATYTRSQGISPGTCTVEMAPQFSPINSPNGKLRFSFGDEIIEFRDCMIDSSNLQSSGGGYVTTLQIFDRRWKWMFGGVFGEYNRRDASGEVTADSEKTPYGLARLLLAAMYEPVTEADNLPIEGRPYVKWEGSNPASELEKLCQQFGYFVTLDIDDNLRIVKQGDGLELPDNALKMQAGTSLNPPEKPDRITVFGAPTRLQAWLLLTAVGLDIDGSIVPIDNLSYRPTGGWEKEEASMPSLRFSSPTLDQQKALSNAIATVWRWFRIELNGYGPDAALDLPPEFNMPAVTDRKYILPISSELVETEKVDGVVRRQQSKVFGIYVKGTSGEKFNSNEDPDKAGTVKTYTTLTTHKKLIPYLEDFTILEQFGIVEFPSQVFQWNRTAGQYDKPELYLKCSFNLRDPEGTGAVYRYAYNYDTGSPTFNTGAEMIPGQERLQRQMYQLITPGANKPAWLDVIGREKTDLDEDAEKLAKAALSKYQNLPSSEASYAGLLRISPDGAIRQVSWEVGPNGATTKASRNCEASPYVPSYRNRRLLENMGDLQLDAKARLPPIPEVV